MKVLLQKNISKLGSIGQVVDVKPGYARNYLLPQGLAVQPTEANMRAIEAAKQQYLEELAKIRSELEAKAKLADGREVTIPARANEEGHLYGSIGPAQLIASLAEENVFVDPEHVVLEQPIRQVGTHEVALQFAEGILATVTVSVIQLGGQEGPVGGEGEAGSQPAVEEGEPSDEAQSDGDSGPAL